MNRGKRVSGNTNDHIVVPVIEERLTVAKKEIETGKVAITKKVHSEQQVIDIPVVDEEVDVQRIQFNQYIENTPPAVRYEGEKTIIPILKEVLVVEKKLVLVEEVHITRKQKHSKISQQETLRKEEVIVNRVDTNPTI
ncbi:YsnF/AvaK domain-containing protein [Paradesertivirga mongoliensis]|uniref:YsnF/AvaK domain-containing protein n=1 Tax=Paradesertivirga mongoliensis TaxID=2100740 RepID=A0ABW4ZNS3_9SPHI|nr:YsnF/AvaK domain-containing protein [Pedobacter mongoliensis]